MAREGCGDPHPRFSALRPPLVVLRCSTTLRASLEGPEGTEDETIVARMKVPAARKEREARLATVAAIIATTAGTGGALRPANPGLVRGEVGWAV
jgi:hypothetical protein